MIRFARTWIGGTNLHVVFKHVCSHADLYNVVDDQLTERGQEIPPLVELFYLHIFINVICEYSRLDGNLFL